MTITKHHSTLRFSQTCIGWFIETKRQMSKKCKHGTSHRASIRRKADFVNHKCKPSFRSRESKQRGCDSSNEPQSFRRTRMIGGMEGKSCDLKATPRFEAQNLEH